MNQCLSEGALLGVLSGDGTTTMHTHLRLCADCAERYDALTNDLEVIGAVLAQPPPQTSLVTRVDIWLLRWVPAVVAVVVLVGAGVVVNRLLAPVPAEFAAYRGSTSALAADVSAALFAGDDASGGTQLAYEAPYLQAALEAGLLCTQERFFRGQCTDSLSALFDTE